MESDDIETVSGYFDTPTQDTRDRIKVLEEAARIADIHAEPTDTPSEFTEAYELAARKIARSIRALGNKETDRHG